MTETNSNPDLIAPYGGSLVDLMVSVEESDEVRVRGNELPSIQLSERSMCDLELLATGGFSPLDRFMGEDTHRSVLDDMRLSSGHVYPIPVTLPVETDQVPPLDKDVALRNSQNDLLAVMTVEEAYDWDRDEVANKVFGSTDPRHPLVAEMHRWGGTNISGPLRVLKLPRHDDFKALRYTPA